MLSVDVPVSANRERNRRNGFSLSLRVTPLMALQALTHPGWTLEYFRNGGLPPLKNYSPYAPPGADAITINNVFASLFPAPSLTWSLLDDVRRIWPRKLFVKGLVHPEDAVRAVSAGADGIMVSITAPASWTERRRRSMSCPRSGLPSEIVRRSPSTAASDAAPILSPPFALERTQSLSVDQRFTARWWAGPPESGKFLISSLLSSRWCLGKWAVPARPILARSSL